MRKKTPISIVDVHPACAALKGLDGTMLVVDYEERTVRRTIEGILIYPPGAQSFYLGERLRYGIIYADHRDASGDEERVHAIRTLDGTELYRRP